MKQNIGKIRKALLERDQEGGRRRTLFWFTLFYFVIRVLCYFVIFCKKNACRMRWNGNCNPLGNRIKDLSIYFRAPSSRVMSDT